MHETFGQRISSSIKKNYLEKNTYVIKFEQEEEDQFKNMLTRIHTVFQAAKVRFKSEKC